MLLPARGVVVNRLRIQSRVDPLTARLRAGWLLDESALQPSGLPPSAILCIRRLKDPQPGSIALDGSRLPPRQWTDLVAASIADLARRAAHPGRGDVPDDVDAVMFADRAELLASLAADWCAGRLASRWWSRELLKGLSDERAILRAWLESAAHIAGALELLAGRRIAETFVRRLAGPDTLALLDAIVFHHGLRWIAPAIEPLIHGTDVRSVTGDAADRGVEWGSGGRPDGLSPPPRPPWIDHVPDGLVALPRADQQCLLGIALTLRRAPAAVRTPRFAERVHEWCARIAHAQANDDATFRAATVESFTGATLTADAAVADVEGDAPPHDVSVEGSRLWSRARTARDRLVDVNGDRTLQVESRVGVSKAIDPAARAERDVSSRSNRAEDGEMDSLGLYAPNEPDDGPAAPPTHARRPNATAPQFDRTIDAQAIRSTAAPAVERACPTSIETQLGGVFYLLNLATSLGLYGDFTAPMQPGLDVSIWDFLALAAQRLTPNQRFRHDGLWTLLADLAGRPRDDEAMIRDLRRRAAPSIRWLTTSLRARLARAGPRIARGHAGTTVCVHRATVLTSATHVDVMFALAELPMAIRLSGLDRDPGWLPAADRVVAFHYD
jgi:hypothetical protein